MADLETFRLRLEELKAQGVDIDPAKVEEEIIQAFGHNDFADNTTLWLLLIGPFGYLFIDKIRHRRKIKFYENS